VIVVAFADEGAAVFVDPAFYVMTLGLIAITALGTAVYYPLGRYFLEICRTKENFLAAPPLIDDPLGTILQKTGKASCSVDHPKKAGGMFGVLLLAWIGFVVVYAWYFSLYSWDKHPIPLGICAALFVAALLLPSALLKKMNVSNALLVNIAFPCFGAVLVLVLEYIEFGSLDFGYVWTLPDSMRGTHNTIHTINLLFLLFAALFVPTGLYRLWKLKQKECDEATISEDMLLQEAITRFDSATMTEDEPEVAAKPFPRYWIWIIGLYAAAIIVACCVGVLLL
jgi:hypothetical protein